MYGLMKRILQCCLMMNVPMACGLLFLLSTVLRERSEIRINPQLKELMEKGAFDGLISREDQEEIVKGVKKEKKEKKEEEEKEEEKEEE